MFDEEEPNPQRNDSLIRLYELLYSLISSLTPSITTISLRDGSGERFNGYIDELISITNDTKLYDFKVKINTINGHASTSGEAYARQLNGVVNYLFKTNKTIDYYCYPPPEVKYSKTSSSPTINNQFHAEQQTQQTTNVQIEFTQTLISLTEAATNLERDYPDESSKENRFAKAIKKSLPTVKGTLEIVALVLKIAAEMGVDPATALKYLKLG